MNFLSLKRFSLVQAAVFALLAAAAAVMLTSFWSRPVAATETAPAQCPVNVHRIGGLKFIRPILFVDEPCEAADLSGIKAHVQQIFSRYQASGELLSGSAYLRDYAANEWTSVNPDEKFQPGSLFKVPLMITALRMDELHPGFLSKRVAYTRYVNVPRQVNIAGKSIVVGKSYSVRELLTYMITESDNQATALLQQQLDMGVLQKLFSDIGLAVPQPGDEQYLFTTSDYSLFMRCIFNAGYLNIDDSEFAATLLSQCRYADGLRRGLPPNLSLAHKFGEAGSQQEKQLHESGIVYLEGKPYLLTVMTKGKDFGRLAQVIADVSAAVYQDMAAR